MAYRQTEKTQARRLEVRQALLDSALELISCEGFDAVSIRAVAKNANLAAGTVYKHFNAKTELCTEVFRLASEAELARVESATKGKGTTTERLRTTIEGFSYRAIKQRRLSYALIAEPVDAAVDVERIRLRKGYADVFSRLVEEGIATKEFVPQQPDVSAAALVGIISEALIGPLSWQSDQQSVIEKELLVSSITEFCLRAVGVQNRGK
ncbi:MAG: TetR/AcrR family transcriptional regulator [Kangiellaceae bacterium]|nr:TetR/AcrR family transcriptional regulator [Kangiellaceae bacterium]